MIADKVKERGETMRPDAKRKGEEQREGNYREKEKGEESHDS